MRLARFKFLIVPIFFVFACVAAMAQGNSQIVGTVTDQTGAAVPGAKLTLTQKETGFTSSSVSNETGGFVFPGLNVGTYTLKATAKGFETYTASGLALNVSQSLAANVKLTVGAESVDVSVTADALQVETDSSTVDTLISGEQVSEIATENRNFAALAALGLGVSSSLPDSNTPTSVAASFTISVNGLRESHNNWLIDGGEADDRGGAGGMDVMPSQDAVAQFEVMASNYPPDYGISSGATISLALKSGTQKYHGELFEFARNDAFDANNFFNKYNGANSPVSKLRQNIFGGNIGGPLFIPHVYNESRQKTFFFWNEEWRKIIQGSAPNVQATIPTADRPTVGSPVTYVAPLFSSGTTIKVPNLGDPAWAAKVAAAGLEVGGAFTNNVIPASLIDPNAAAYLATNIIPKPVTSDGKAVGSANSAINVREDLVRVDHKVNDKWQFMAHYIHDNVSQGYPQPMLGWLWATYNTITSTLSNPSNSAALRLSGTITPNLLLETSFLYDGNIINITNSANAKKPAGWTVNKYFNNNGNGTMPGINWGGPYYEAEDTGSAPWHNAAEDYSPKIDLSYTKGKHALKFGFGYNRYTKNQQLFGDPQGSYGIGNQSGDAFVDFILGIAGGYSEFQQTPIRHYVNQTTSVYANDNWKISPRLSLQIGARFDALPHAWERANQVANFDPANYLSSLAPVWKADGSLDPNGPGFVTPAGSSVPFYLNGMGLAGQNGFPPGLVTNDYKTLQPRVGFSYDLTGNGKTVLRGGFGTFFERLQGNDIYNAATNPPFAFNPSAGNVYFSNPNTSWVTGATAATPFFASGLTNLAKSYKAPAVAQFSLGLQRELTPSVLWVVQYVGNLAWHQNITRNINNYPLNSDISLRCNAGDGGNKYNSGADVCPNGSAPSNLANGNLYRTYQGYAGINQEENTTNGGYNGFQTGLRIQGKWGLSGELDYTYSHEIDLTSYDLSGVSNPFNLKYDKASGALDRRHILNANYIYKLPIFSKSSGLAHSLIGGWELAGTFIDETGVPLPVGISMDWDSIGLGGGYTNRPNVTGKMHYSKKIANYFDTSVFGAPTPVWAGGNNQGFGDGRRDTIVGPGRVNFTTSLYKSFAFGERAHFEFRAESFNTFNHTEQNGLGVSAQFNDASVSKGNAGNFGQVTSTWDPRVLELGGKFVF